MPASIGIIGVIVGAIITYYLNNKNNKKNIIYNVLLDYYHEFIKLKTEFDYNVIDVEVCKLQELFTDEIKNKCLIIEEMNKLIESLKKMYTSVGKIKKHMLNGQYILEKNNINIEHIIKIKGFEEIGKISEEINNFKYNTKRFSEQILLENQRQNIEFINQFSELLIDIKVEIEKLLFKEKLS